MNRSQTAMAGVRLLMLAGQVCLGAVPASGTYVLGPEDQVVVRALHVVEISDKPVAVSSAGYVTLPMIGVTEAAGKTVEQLAETIRKKLMEYYQNPQVSVMVTEYRSQPVSVMGAVNKPGVYQLRGPRRLLEVLSMAEGPKADAGHEVQITRKMDQGRLPVAGAREDIAGKVSYAVIDLAAAMRGAGESDGNILIRPDDVIVIPQVAKIFVLGDVARPGAYPIVDGKVVSVLEAVSLAGGPSRTAAPERSKILRLVGEGKERRPVVADVKGILAGKAADVPLQSNDILYIPNSAMKSMGIRTMETLMQTASGMAIWWPR